jgi:RNA methyltransferase, TrmH family
MLSRSESKYIQTLHHKKQRDSEGLFIVEGPKIVNELINSNYVIRKIYATATWMKENALINDVVEVSEDELQKISNLQTANQVLAIVEKPTMKRNAESSITIVLDGIQDPGNLGTIIRIADWFGVKKIICSDDCVELYNPKVIQSTMGSFIRVDVDEIDLPSWFAKNKLTVYGALLNGKNIKAIGKIDKGVIVIGNESKGIRPNILPFIQQAISIERVGAAESLNASVATGIILSHLL